ncbi:MAG: hypothetical protein AAB066_04695 [Candidatus Margulisiibacteriota bacterium]
MKDQHPQTQPQSTTPPIQPTPQRTQPQLMFWNPHSSQLEAMRRQAAIFSSAPLE